MNMFTKATLATLVLAGSFSAAYAAGPVAGTIQTATANLVFVAPEAISHTLTATAPSFSSTLANNTKLADGVVTVLDGSNQNLAIRWSTTGNQSFTNALGHLVTVTGTESSANALRLNLDLNLPVSTDNWFVTNLTNSQTYSILADGDQTVPADTYVVSMDAAVWTA